MSLINGAKSDEEKCFVQSTAAELLWGGILREKKLQLNDIKNSHQAAMLGFAPYEFHKKYITEQLEKSKQDFSEVKSATVKARARLQDSIQSIQDQLDSLMIQYKSLLHDRELKGQELRNVQRKYSHNKRVYLTLENQKLITLNVLSRTTRTATIISQTVETCTYRKKVLWNRLSQVNDVKAAVQRNLSLAKGETPKQQLMKAQINPMTANLFLPVNIPVYKYPFTPQANQNPLRNINQYRPQQIQSSPYSPGKNSVSDMLNKFRQKKQQNRPLSNLFNRFQPGKSQPKIINSFPYNRTPKKKKNVSQLKTIEETEFLDGPEEEEIDYMLDGKKLTKEQFEKLQKEGAKVKEVKSEVKRAPVEIPNKKETVMYNVDGKIVNEQEYQRMKKNGELDED